MTNAELIRHVMTAPIDAITKEQGAQFHMLVNLTGELGVCQKDFAVMKLETNPPYSFCTWVCPTCGWRVGK